MSPEKGKKHHAKTIANVVCDGDDNRRTSNRIQELKERHAREIDELDKLEQSAEEELQGFKTPPDENSVVEVDSDDPSDEELDDFTSNKSTNESEVEMEENDDIASESEDAIPE